MKNNGGTYFSKTSLQKRKNTIANDLGFWSRRDAKSKETKVKNGHSPTWNNPGLKTTMEHGRQMKA